MPRLDIKTELRKKINHVLKIRDFIFNLIFPTICLNCGHEGSWLCQSCGAKLKFLPHQSCFGCKITNTGEFCSDCRKNYSLEGILIAGDYDDKLLNALIKKLKYNFAKDIAKILGNYLVSFLQKSTADRATWQSLASEQKLIIIPVPLHPRRERWRGFNQAEAIANVVAERLQLPLIKNNLIRTKHREAQAKLNETQRQENVKNCFGWRGENLQQKNILLIDDVATTGATLNECAKILKENGAGQVWGLVAAKG
jgi:ComF family protein